MGRKSFRIFLKGSYDNLQPPIFKGMSFTGKKRTEKLYPRETHIELTIHTNPCRIDKLQTTKDGIKLFDHEGQPIQIINSVNTLQRERRANGKVKTIGVVSGKTAFTDQNMYLLNYDAIYAVDTGTKEINGTWYSEGTLIKFIRCQISDNEYGFTPEIISHISFNSPYHRYDEELIVWWNAILKIQEIEIPTHIIALVVDCDGGNIEKYNERIMKIHEFGYLPENITLLYASGDHSDKVINKMIKYADFCASEKLEKISATLSL